MPDYPYRISFYNYGLIGLTITVVVGVVVSLLTGGRDQRVNRDLISPVMHWAIKDRRNEYDTVEMANKKLEDNCDDKMYAER